MRTGDNTVAVASGLERGGRLITGAAAIMFTVFMAFGLAEVVTIKAIGIGLPIAVAIDATVLRALAAGGQPRRPARDKPVPEGATKSPQDMLKLAASSLIGLDEVKKAEARAEMAAVGHAARPGAPPPASERDPRPLAEAIVGTWTNGMITVTFNADGSATMDLPRGIQRQAHWSVDSQGRLVADVMGEQQVGEAWVTGDHLNITQSGEGIVLRRA